MFSADHPRYKWVALSNTTLGTLLGGALWLIGWRVLQAVGGAMLMANSAAIITDAFPAPAARHGARRQHRLRAGRLVHRPGGRRCAGRVGLAVGVLGEHPARRAGHSPAGDPRRLRLSGLRRPDLRQRPGRGPVRGAEHVAGDEQRPGTHARRGVGHAGHLSERRSGALHRCLLLAHGGRAGQPSADHAELGPDRAGRAGRHREPDRRSGAAALASFGLLARLAAPHERGRLLAVALVIAYLAFSVPAVVAGVAAGIVGLHTTALACGTVVAALGATALFARRGHQRTATS